MRRAARHIAFAALLAGAGCAQFPELDSTRTPGVAEAPYPDLLPLEQLTDGPRPTVQDGSVAAVEGRVGSLRARADRLKRLRVGPPPGSVSDRLARLRQRAATLRMQ